LIRSHRRIEPIRKDLERVEIDEITVLPKAVPGDATAGAEVGRESLGDPGEAPDRSPRRAEIDLEGRGQRYSLKGGRLLNREVVVIEPVTELGLRGRACGRDAEHRVHAWRHAVGHVEHDRRGAEVAPVHGELVGQEGEYLAASGREIEAAANGDRSRGRAEQESIAGALRAGRARGDDRQGERKAGGKRALVKSRQRRVGVEQAGVARTHGGDLHGEGG
jgi:hypothetical protein